MFGCDREEELIGHPLTDRILPDDRARASSTIALILSGEAPGPTEYRALRADGGTFVVEINGEVVRDADGQPAQVATIVRDITERKRAEEALAAEKEHLAVTLRSIGDGVITTDVRGTVVLMNRVAEDLTGWKQDEAAGMVLGDIFRIIHQATRLPCEDPVAKVLASGMIVGLANHTVLIAKDGTERVLADSGAPIRNRDSRITGVVLVFRDVTQEHLRKEDLQKAQKLESIGLLAGGIAHDFNNLLTAILGNISLTRLGNASATQQAEWLTEAEKAVGRARDLTQQLLTFSKGGSPIRKTARLGEMIMDSTGFSLRGSNVRCSFSIPEDLWPVEADLCQLSQVISNLVINADEAMPSGGTIRVSGRNLEIGMPRPESLPEGRFVEISVEDEGFGIDEEHLQRVFDPYFTTKKKGNGLGLATSYSIVRHHDGLISVNSKRGHGSTFRMFLPASERQPPPPAVNQAVLPGNGRILVMDDEEMILRVASQMLSFLGYEVETASDGAGAIERFAAAQASSRPFDAVILDITVPGGMGGKETVQRLRASDPDVRAIVSSGYSNDPIMADFRTHGFKGIAVKPYELLSLSRALHDVLSS
jgi:PAS domain S-box-containing protein